jgi:hypothetical protein
LHAASFLEKVGASLSLPWGGVLIVEATKVLYRPVGARVQTQYAIPGLKPGLAPEPAGVLPG